ncbi:hypothetical protein C9374_013705 [Naegleria lovaniensis]|uniref:Uncharacterized protein n=1 Tax=Naegleria lovaniensis TaxID=51637 RepID=A0AA88G9E8_NAELO|nr:uncharacterized protein C9374_013705 [Naegleria lovaniensis]KAG2372641.1 hypothetical protein C9374_013705 [Naegleria lovaniensis]
MISTTWTCCLLLVLSLLSLQVLTVTGQHQCCLPPQYSHHVRTQTATSSNALKANFTTLTVHHTYVDSLQHRIREDYLQVYFNEYPQPSYSILSFLSSDLSMKYIYRWNSTLCSCRKERNTGGTPFKKTCAQGSTVKTSNIGLYPIMLFTDQVYNSQQFVNTRFVTSRVNGHPGNCWIVEADEISDNANRKEYMNAVFSEQRAVVSENDFVLDSKCPSIDKCSWEQA